jgi:hypothetical protein
MSESGRPLPRDLGTACSAAGQPQHPSRKRKLEPPQDVHDQLIEGTLNKSNLRVTSGTLNNIKENTGATKRTKIDAEPKAPYVEPQSTTETSGSRPADSPYSIQQITQHGTTPIRDIIISYVRNFMGRTRSMFRTMGPSDPAGLDDREADDMELDDESLPSNEVATLNMNLPPTPDPPPSSSSDMTSAILTSSAQDETDSSLDGINEDNRSLGVGEEQTHHNSSNMEVSPREEAELDIASSHDSESTVRAAKSSRSTNRNEIAHSALIETCSDSLSPPPASDWNPSSSRGSSPGPPSPPSVPPMVNERKDSGIFAKTSLIAYLDGFRKKRTESAVITLDSGSDIDAIAGYWATKHNLKRFKLPTARTVTAIDGEPVTITEWVKLAHKFNGEKEWIDLYIIEDNEDFEILFGTETIKAKKIYKKEGSGKLYIVTSRRKNKLREGNLSLTPSERPLLT